MIVILDPLNNEVLLTSKIFERPFDPLTPKLTLRDLISVIEDPDVMIDPENETDYIYYIKTLKREITVLFSAIPVGDHLLASALVINPMKSYLDEISKTGLRINFTMSANLGMLSPGLPLYN